MESPKALSRRGIVAAGLRLDVTLPRPYRRYGDPSRKLEASESAAILAGYHRFTFTPEEKVIVSRLAGKVSDRERGGMPSRLRGLPRSALRAVVAGLAKRFL